MSEFHRSPPENWIINASGDASSLVSKQRRDRLLNGPSFEEIVAQIAKNCKIVTFGLEICDEKKSFLRVYFVLKTCSQLVDLFHNSASGYRAQYYFRQENGDRANRHAIDTISSKLFQQFNISDYSETSKMFHSILHPTESYRDFLEKSLKGDGSKLWINQD